MDALPLDPDPLPLLISVSVEGTGAAVRRAPSEPRQGRSKTKRRAPGRDKRRKTLSKGITAKERKNLIGADTFARLIRRHLNTTLDFHPCHLADYPTQSLAGC